MITKKISIAIPIIISVVIIGGWNMRQTWHRSNPSPTTTTSTSEEPPIVTTSTQEELIHVSTPRPGDVITSPLVVEGEARGQWYFEASFPVKIVDGNGKVLGSTPAQAQGEWMTKEFVPFKAELSFVTSTTETGELILEKDNPSGLPENADEIRIPIRFDLSNVKLQPVKLYYYNPDKDKGNGGLVICSQQGLVAVERKIPISKTPIQDTIRLLLEGYITTEERAQGVTTEFPLPGLDLKGASLKNGVLTFTFDDPQYKTSGGSCRVGILRMQIEETAKQFPGVKTVRFEAEKDFHHVFEP